MEIPPTARIPFKKADSTRPFEKGRAASCANAARSGGKLLLGQLIACGGDHSAQESNQEQADAHDGPDDSGHLGIGVIYV